MSEKVYRDVYFIKNFDLVFVISAGFVDENGVYTEKFEVTKCN